MVRCRLSGVGVRNVRQGKTSFGRITAYVRTGTACCVGNNLSGVCQGYCVQTCWHACQQKCSDNCSWKCSTNCGSGCANNCSQACTGCANECSESCTNHTMRHACNGCSFEGGCMATCKLDCNGSCMGNGCKAMCGSYGGNACEANCRMNCTGTSCTAMCSDACSDQCTTCVNNCDMKCGTCTSSCSTGCTQECNITCTATCEHSCETNCVHSCTEECGACSSLCYSCTGMCIGVCSLKCQNGCTSCANNCGFWCDTTCTQTCFANCDDSCIHTCVASCISYLESNTTLTSGPDRDPISEGYIYPHPKNRWEERESFKITRDIPKVEDKPEEVKLIHVTFDSERNLDITCPEELEYIIRLTVATGGIYTIDETTGEIIIDEDMLPGTIESNKPNINDNASYFIIIFKPNNDIQFTNDDISSKMPLGFELLPLIKDKDNNSILIIEKDMFLYPEEGDEL